MKIKIRKDNTTVQVEENLLPIWLKQGWRVIEEKPKQDTQITTIIISEKENTPINEDSDNPPTADTGTKNNHPTGIARAESVRGDSLPERSDDPGHSGGKPKKKPGSGNEGAGFGGGN